jgi:WD40 repeat protein
LQEAYSPMLQELDNFKFGTEQIMAVALPEPDIVLAGSWTGNVAFRDSQGNTTQRVAVSEGRGVMGVAGPTVLGEIAVAGYDGVLHMFDLKRRELRRNITVSDLPITCAVVCREGQIVALGGRSREVFILDAREFSLTQRLGVHDGWVEAVAVSPDGSMVASGTQAGTIQLWNRATGMSLSAFKAHSGAVMCLAISANGKTLVSGGQDNLVKLWSIADVPVLQGVLAGHESTVRGAAFLADPNMIVSVSQDRTIRIWRLDVGSEIHRHRTNDGWLTCLAMAHDQTVIATGSLLGTVRVWEVKAPGDGTVGHPR